MSFEGLSSGESLAIAPAADSVPPDTARGAFALLGLSPAIEQRLQQLGITEPTRVQAQAIPALLAGRDLLATAPTGTGKTAAFLLPAIDRLVATPRPAGKGPRVVVLTPTRELAQQVAQAAIDFVRGTTLHVACITGGASYQKQARDLARPVDILVATPGRLIDQMDSGRLSFSRTSVLVLDEADRMLDMGFSDDVLRIAGAMPQPRQTACFTATFERSMRALAQQLLVSPTTVEVAPAPARASAIEQHVLWVDDVGHRHRLLRALLARTGREQSIVFTATKRDADALARELDAEGVDTVVLHGDLDQRTRTRMLGRLRDGDAQVLVATDVAARGIDVPGIGYVINFDLPNAAEDYVHRIGRTGRAGATGTAWTFAGHDERFRIKRIERLVGRSLAPLVVEGHEPRRAAAPAPRRPHGAAPAPWHKRPTSTAPASPARGRPASAGTSGWTSAGGSRKSTGDTARRPRARG